MGKKDLQMNHLKSSSREIVKELVSKVMEDDMPEFNITYTDQDGSEDEWGTQAEDEEDAREKFKKNMPGCKIKSVKKSH